MKYLIKPKFNNGDKGDELLNEYETILKKLTGE